MKQSRTSKGKLFRAMLSAMALGAMALAGCGGGGGGTSVTAQQPVTRVFIINGLGKTLSVIDADTNKIQNNVTNLGLYPNQIVTEGDYGYVVNSGDNAVQIIKMSDYSTVGQISIGTGSNPWGIAFANASKAYVSNLFTNTVSVIDVAGQKVTKTIAVGTAPEGIVAADNKVYVCNTGVTFDPKTFATTYGPGTVSVIDINTDQVIKTINVGINPQSAAVDLQGNVNVLCTGDYGATSGTVYKISPLTDTQVGSPIALGGSPGVLSIGTNGRGYAGDPNLGVLIYDTATGTVIRNAQDPLKAGKGVEGVLAGPNNKLYVCNFNDDTVSIFAMTDNSLITTVTAGDGPQSPSSRARRLSD